LPCPIQEPVPGQIDPKIQAICPLSGDRDDGVLTLINGGAMTGILYSLAEGWRRSRTTAAAVRLLVLVYRVPYDARLNQRVQAIEAELPHYPATDHDIALSYVVELLKAIPVDESRRFRRVVAKYLAIAETADEQLLYEVPSPLIELRRLAKDQFKLGAPAGERMVLPCPMCSQRLHARLGKELQITCPKCSHSFDADLSRTL